MSPTLPSEDPLPPVRRALLDLARSQRRYDYSLPDGVAALAELLPEDKPGPHYLLKIAESNERVASHHVGTSVAAYAARKPAGVLSVERYALKTFLESVKDFWDSTDEAAKATPKAPLASIAAYGDLTDALEVIPIVTTLRADPSLRDALYGWQRKGGVNPLQIARVRDRLPDSFAVDEASFQRGATALGAAMEGDSIAAALAEGRLYLSDCGALDGVETTENAGRRKYTAAPFGLFVRPRRDAAALLPIAIQCAQRPSADAPVFTPADGFRWRLAQAFLQVAESTIHEGGEHLGLTHLVVEAFAIAASRQLASAHPLWLLLRPHFEGTHFINYTARHSLIADGGTLDQLMAQPIATTRSLVQRSLSAFRVDQGDPRSRLAARGLLDADGLAEHPYREDALPLYDEIQTWVTDYLRLYYVDDAAVAGDPELRAFVAEVGARDGGRLAGVPTVDSVDSLARLVTFVIFTASVQHAAVNFPQYPFMGWVANMPAALYSPPPTLQTPDTEAALLAALPQADVTFLQMYTVYQLSAIRTEPLGIYPSFSDDRVAGPLERFQRRLADLEPEQRRRDAKRPLPYPYLFPSLLPMSIII